MEISRIGIISHPDVKKELLLKTAKILGKHAQLSFDPIAAQKTGAAKTDPKKMDVDLAVVFGGDGTLLWSAAQLKGSPLLLGVNTGRVGFLQELSEKTLESGLKRILSGKFRIEERTRLRIDGRHDVLNEAVIAPKRPASLLEFKIKIDGTDTTEFRSDGVIAATQTGSTAHALSAGGPVIHPQADVYLIMPIVPFMQKQHPLILPASSKTEIEVIGKNPDAYLVLDGKTQALKNRKITVEKSSRPVRMVRLTTKELILP